MGSSGLVESGSAVEPAAVPHVRAGRARGVTMTPRGGLDRGGMGAGRPKARPFRLDPSDVRGGHDRARSASRGTRHRRAQGHRRPHGATRPGRAMAPEP